MLGWDLHTAVGQVLFRPKRDVNLPDPVVLLATRQQARLGKGGVLLAHSGPWSVIAIRPRAGCTATTPRVVQGASKHTMPEISAAVGVSRATLYRHLALSDETKQAA